MRIAELLDRPLEKEVRLGSSQRTFTVRFVAETTVTRVEDQLEPEVPKDEYAWRDAAFLRRNHLTMQRKAAAVVGVALGVEDAKGEKWDDSWGRERIEAFADEVRGALTDPEMKELFAQVIDYDGRPLRLKAINTLEHLRSEVLPRLRGTVLDEDKGTLASRTHAVFTALTQHLAAIGRALDEGELDDIPGAAALDDGLIGTAGRLGNSSGPCHDGPTGDATPGGSGGCPTPATTASPGAT